MFIQSITRAFIKEKSKLLQMKNKKKLSGFSFSINIANFEAFVSVFKLTKNPLFLKSEQALVLPPTFCYAIKYKWWKNKYKIGKAILNVDA